MNRNVIGKSALVPLEELKKLRKRTSDCLSPDEQSGEPYSKKLKVSDSHHSDDPNLRESINLRQKMAKIVSDTSLDDNQQSQQYLSTLRNFLLFRSKHRRSHQEPISVKIVSPVQQSSKEVSSNSISPVKKVQQVDFETPRREYAGDVSPTRSLIKREETEEEETESETEHNGKPDFLSAVQTGIRGVHKLRAKELFNNLQDIPAITWNDSGTVSINGRLLPGSNIKNFVQYEVIKYTKKGKETVPPRYYEQFFSLLKSNDISPHKTNRESRALTFVGEKAGPSSESAETDQTAGGFWYSY